MAVHKEEASGPRPSSRLTTVDRLRTTEQVRLQLERVLRNGSLAPGERLPSERELAETFGVSRVSVREAVRALVAVGLVTVHQGRGAFVADRRSGVGEPLARWLGLHRDEVLELHDVRWALDGLAADLAARQADPEQVDAIVAAHQAFVQAVERQAPSEEVAALDVDFHVAIAEASGNRLLYDLLSDLHAYVLRTRQLVLTEDLVQPFDHKLIAEAIAAGDPAAAREATAKHTANVRAAIMRCMDEEGAG